MREIGASFIFTGEVLGQRPMSQHKPSLQIIERESGLEGFIVRPLSARLLPPSVTEQEGWIDREKLLEKRRLPDKKIHIMLARPACDDEIQRYRI